MKDNPIVSACLIVYNQVDFVKECIEGALKQQIDYSYEIVIGDDHSTDGTHEVCNAYAQKHPNLIRYYKREKNLGMVSNWAETIGNCEGKYIAICEGDDYWTDPHKLQTQFNYMESHPNCAFCFHKVKELDADGVHEDKLNVQHKEQFHLNDILNKNYAHTPSIMFRADQLTIPCFFYNAMPGDHTLQCILLRNGGYAFYMKEAMAVYRKHEGGIWSSDGGKKFAVERAITKINLYNYLNITDEKIVDNPYYMLADFFAKNGYSKMSFFNYYKLLLNHFGWIALFSRKKIYLFHPRTVYLLKKLIG